MVSPVTQTIQIQPTKVHHWIESEVQNLSTRRFPKIHSKDSFCSLWGPESPEQTSVRVSQIFKINRCYEIKRNSSSFHFWISHFVFSILYWISRFRHFYSSVICPSPGALYTVVTLKHRNTKAVPSRLSRHLRCRLAVPDLRNQCSHAVMPLYEEMTRYRRYHSYFSVPPQATTM